MKQQEFLHARRVAYFSMEIALESRIPTYSGGLGILAGDTLRSAADLEIPMVGVTLASRRGYFLQEINNGSQVERRERWDPEEHAQALPAKGSVTIEGRTVWISAWLYVIKGMGGFRQPVILLDTDVAENTPEDRKITHHLYGGDQAYRLKQEIVLGIGGCRMLRSLGFNVDVYHLNEGHSALLTLQLLLRSAYPRESLMPGESPYDIFGVRERCHFTTHTPIEAGQDRFSYDLVNRIMGNIIDQGVLERLAGSNELNMTRLALNMSEYQNGVAKRHAETSEKLFPGYRVSAITNGVHTFTWANSPLAKLFDNNLPGWASEPELLMRADYELPDDELWESHNQAKSELLRNIYRLTSVEMDPELPTLGYARRITPYKRPDLLFSNLDRLRDIARRQPFQVVLAGKAHPRDEAGKRAIEFLHQTISELKGDITMAFLPNYNMASALTLVSGVDVWLNTPQPPLEASGTSGMKAALNGVPNLSVLDGWWIEGHIEGVTGWSIGNGDAGDYARDADSLYDKLDQVVLPLFGQRDEWLKVMKGTISRNASLFHSHRMMRRYAAEAYMR
ncbi:MAG: alpha-glucan family phosphorylase [Xanthomonadales bacterium]|nr:alpha-glucan family phosphorylase [Xanthomonadales bacterium]